MADVTGAEAAMTPGEAASALATKLTELHRACPAFWAGPEGGSFYWGDLTATPTYRGELEQGDDGTWRVVTWAKGQDGQLER
jgi:hypothetical protein